MSTVDFLPTVLGLMEVQTAGLEQGRDASKLFLSGKAPEDWEDMIFLRGTGQRDNKPDVNWLAAVTDRYKLIYSPRDEPWLIDLEEDPNELVNQFENSQYDEVVSELASALVDYGEANNDPRIHMSKFKNELEQSISRQQ